MLGGGAAFGGFLLGGDRRSVGFFSLGNTAALNLLMLGGGPASPLFVKKSTQELRGLVKMRSAHLKLPPVGRGQLWESLLAVAI